MVATAHGRKTPHRTPVCEELDLSCGMKLVFVQKLHLFLEISTKTAASRAALFDSSMHKIICWLGLHPKPHWGSIPGPELRGTNWAVAHGPPQLRDLHKTVKKIIT